MYYEISRGLRTGRQITTAQRTSPRFAEEPVVMGKVLRRGSAPLVLTDAQFQQNRVPLIRLLTAGAINIMVLDGIKRVPFDLKAGGEAQTGAPASTPAPKAEEPEVAVAPPSSPPEAPAVEEPAAELPPPDPVVEEAPVAEPAVEPKRKKRG